MANKLIKDMDEEVWRRFVAFCKIKNVKVADELSRIIKLDIKKNLKEMLR